MNQLKKYIDANRQRFIDELIEYLRFPSVSAQSAHKKDMADCARWLAGHAKSFGLKSRVHRTGGHPIVTAATPRRRNSAKPAIDKIRMLTFFFIIWIARLEA